MMAGSFQVDTAAVAQHADGLAQLAESLSAAAALAARATLAGDALGAAGQGIAEELGKAGPAGQEALAAGAEGLTSVGQDVADTAVAYQGFSDSYAADIDSATSGMA